MMGFGMAFGPLLMILLWGGLVVLVVWLVRTLFPRTAQPPGLPEGRELSGREILDRRFARGEISRDEYEAMRETMGG